MKAVLPRTVPIHSHTALAMNSGPQYIGKEALVKAMAARGALKSRSGGP